MTRITTFKIKYKLYVCRLYNAHIKYKLNYCNPIYILCIFIYEYLVCTSIYKYNTDYGVPVADYKMDSHRVRLNNGQL